MTEWVSAWRALGDGISGKSAFVPLKFKLGEEFQFDWSEESLVIGGILRKVIASHTKLCSSRAFFISGYPGQSHEMLFDAHNRAFAALGGVASMRLSFDGLYALTRHTMKQDLLSGHLFTFINRRATQVKVLYFDRTVGGVNYLGR